MSDELVRYARDHLERILAGEEELPLEYEKYKHVLRAIQWQDSSGGPTLTSSWTASMRRDLVKRLVALLQGNVVFDPTQVKTPRNIFEDDDDGLPTTILREQDAWNIFVSHIANSLALDLSGKLNWSITDYSWGQLLILLDSRSFFEWSHGIRGYYINIYVSGYVTPTYPGIVHGFLNANNIIRGDLRGDRLDSIGALLNWCRGNLHHFSKEASMGNMENQWQYRGWPPVRRMIEGTPNNDLDPAYTDSRKCRRTAGCWGTTGFIQAVLRVINIPVQLVILGWGWSRMHATPHFVTEGMYLSDGDSPYNNFAYATPPYPAKELLIDQSTFDSWFGYPNVSLADCYRNLGRQVYELALKYLPNYLLKRYCQGLSLGYPPEQTVYEHFSRWYTESELQALDLVNRIQAKVDSFGGCQNIPQITGPQC